MNSKIELIGKVGVIFLASGVATYIVKIGNVLQEVTTFWVAIGLIIISSMWTRDELNRGR